MDYTTITHRNQKINNANNDATDYIKSMFIKKKNQNVKYIFHRCLSLLANNVP